MARDPDMSAIIALRKPLPKRKPPPSGAEFLAVRVREGGHHRAKARGLVDPVLEEPADAAQERAGLAQALGVRPFARSRIGPSGTDPLGQRGRRAAPGASFDPAAFVCAGGRDARRGRRGPGSRGQGRRHPRSWPREQLIHGLPMEVRFHHGWEWQRAVGSVWFDPSRNAHGPCSEIDPMIPDRPLPKRSRPRCWRARSAITTGS